MIKGIKYVAGLAIKHDSQAFFNLASCFGTIFDKGYMWTPSYGTQKAISINYEFKKDVNAQLAFSMKQAGVGLSKNIGHGIKVGVGVASEYKKFKPEIYASIMKEWKFK